MDTSIIVAAIGVFGIFLGAILNGAGFLFKSRTEEIKIINRNICNLFQVWHIAIILEKFDSDKFSSLYLSKIKDFLPDNSLTEKQQEEMLSCCSQLVNQITIDSLKTIDVNFKDSFLSGIVDLSEVSPVLAYKLGTNTSINDLLDHFDSYKNFFQKDNLNFNISKTEDFDRGLQAGLQMSKKWIAQEFSKNLQKDICELSFAGGILVWISCKRMIARINRTFDDKTADKALDQYIEKEVKPLLEGIFTNQNVNQ